MLKQKQENASAGLKMALNAKFASKVIVETENNKSKI